MGETLAKIILGVLFGLLMVGAILGFALTIVMAFFEPHLWIPLGAIAASAAAWAMNRVSKELLL